jgi:hypothetical protein
MAGGAAQRSARMSAAEISVTCSLLIFFSRQCLLAETCVISAG